MMYSLSGVAEFRSGKAPILIATDVASRGLGMSCALKCIEKIFLCITAHTHKLFDHLINRIMEM